jgi:acetoin utilization deacetylase AcuC-like enzyme/ankyrin repeat protein
VETVTRLLSPPPPPPPMSQPVLGNASNMGEDDADNLTTINNNGVVVMGEDGGMGMDLERQKEEQKLVNVRLLSQKDMHECTPLYVALLNSELDCMKVLLDHGARVHQKLEGSLPLHVAVQVASLDHVQEKHGGVFGVDAIKMLVEYGCVVLDRDDHGRTPLHWAAALGLVDECACLVDLGKTLMHVQPDSLEENPFDAPPLWDFQDKQGNLAVHLAARYGNVDACRLLVGLKPEVVSEKNKGGLSVAHMVAIGGNVECARALLEHHDVSYLNSLMNRRMQSPAEVAEKRGCLNVAAVLRGHAGAHAEPPSTPTKRQREKKTLIVAPPECLEHYTAPWPMSRDDDAPPPENVNRLHVLTNPEIGSLRTRVFRDGALLWDQKSRKATMADILKVHDWAYVLKLKTASECIQDDPSDIRHLDGDTAISHGTYRAALAAAGAVCHAVDEVMSGKAKNAFCPVRPPGHHAGPHGVVTSRMDPNGSHGFCLLNNVAIGAAYAMSVYRHAGIKKVAILDFDVHHGNGTEACVANTAPSLDTFEFATPYGKGTQTFPIYKPWCDDNDKDNVFFASVQGYGPKGYGMGAYVYPGSGATCDTKQVNKPPGEEINEMDEDTPSVQEIEEDPDAEFCYQGGEIPRTEGPRIIDVGIPGPGHHVPMWKRSWRDKIFPALVKFEPDLILLSAGFDAHRKDDINFSYIGIQEKDFEWITDQVVQIANRCCHGRVVSVLEGGYRIQGNIVSAFARSVAAHVRALSEMNLQEWDPIDAKFEREREKKLRAEAEAKKLAEEAEAKRLAEEAEAARQAALQAAHAEGATALDNSNPDPEATASPEAGGRQKRRRSTVDYVALNKKLQEEEQAKKAST